MWSFQRRAYVKTLRRCHNTTVHVINVRPSIVVTDRRRNGSKVTAPIGSQGLGDTPGGPPAPRCSYPGHGSWRRRNSHRRGAGHWYGKAHHQRYESGSGSLQYPETEGVCWFQGRPPPRALHHKQEDRGMCL